MMTVQSVPFVPTGAVRYALQADGTVLVYMPGDTLPPDPEPGPPPVPAEVTMRQARAVLIVRGLLPQVEAAIDAIPDATQRALARNEWERSTVVQRNRGLVVQMAGALGLSSEQIDALFIAAAAIP